MPRLLGRGTRQVSAYLRERECPTCLGGGGWGFTDTDDDGFEVDSWDRCKDCGGTGEAERSDGGGPLPASATPFSDPSPFDQRWNAMERASEESLRRLERW